MRSWRRPARPRCSTRCGSARATASPRAPPRTAPGGLHRTGRRRRPAARRSRDPRALRGFLLSTALTSSRVRRRPARAAGLADGPHSRPAPVRRPGGVQARSVGNGRVKESEFDAFVAPLIERAERYSPGNRRAIAELAGKRGIPWPPTTTRRRARRRVGRARRPHRRVPDHRDRRQGGRGARPANRDGRAQHRPRRQPIGQRGRRRTARARAAAHPVIRLRAVKPAAGCVPALRGRPLGLADGAKLVSGNPARAVGLDDRGEIAIGKRADLVRVRPYDLPATERHPRGRRVPVVRSVYRQGARVS